MLVSYDWLKDYLGPDAPSPEEVAALLTAHAFEIDGVEAVGVDVAIDVDVLPNRSSDCLCHRGIARELAAITGRPLTHDPLATPPQLPPSDAIDVTIKAATDCPRFAAALIEDVTVGPSPAWLQARLATLGQRSINNVVDATNYVMYAIGQPLHAYDADRFPQVAGKWRFAVRRARAGETVSLIPEGGKEDDRVVELAGGELLIVDASADTPIGLAGVKGGRYAGVQEGTTRIIVEAAHFNPTLTRKTARGLGIVIDASKRFENEPSRALPPYALQEVAALIADIAGGRLVGVIDTYLEPTAPPSVTVRPDRVNALLGLALAPEEMMAILERLGATVERVDDALHATAPLERTDLTLEVDYVEEIGRLYGLDHVVAVPPAPAPLGEINARHYYAEQVRDLLIDRGFTEVITSSFVKKGEIELKNALASDKRFVRPHLRRSLTAVLDKNAGHADLLGTADTRVFELGTVFDQGEGTVGEHEALAIGVRLRPSGYSGKEDKPLREVLDAIATSLGVAIDWTIEQGVAECNFSALVAALPTPSAYAPVRHVTAARFRPFSVYPAVSRDIALWVDAGTPAAEVAAILDAHAGPLRVRTTRFDEFSKDGRTSYAFRLVFQAPDRTLTDSEVNSCMDAVYQAAADRGFEVR